MPPLDIRTLSFMTLTTCVILGVCLILFARTQKKFKGIEGIGGSFLLLGFGFLLLGFRGMIPDFVTIILANAVIFLSSVLFCEALFRFRGITNRFRPAAPVLMIVLVVLFWHFTYHRNEINARIMIISSFIAAQYIVASSALFYRLPETGKSPYLIVGTALLFYSFFLIFRSVWTANETTLADFMKAGTVHALGIMTIVYVLLATSFGVIWIVSISLSSDLEKQIRMDPLTGIFNRRAMKEHGERLLPRMIRENRPLSIVLIDLDYFKKINDTRGHRIGDMVLREFAALMSRQLRVYDIFARYGGEEFILILPGVARLEALQISERLRTVVAEHGFQGIPGLTSSFGISTRTGPQIDWERMLSESDHALYQAKRTGRNRVVHFQKRG